MVGGGDPLYLKFWAELIPFLRKRRFLIDFGCLCLMLHFSSVYMNKSIQNRAPVRSVFDVLNYGVGQSSSYATML